VRFTDLFQEGESELFDSFLSEVDGGHSLKGTYAILWYDTITSEWKGFHTDNTEGE